MHNFSIISEQAEKNFEARTKARDQALVQARQLTRLAAHTIRAIHRSESEAAHDLLDQARQIVEAMKKDLADFPDILGRDFADDRAAIGKEINHANSRQFDQRFTDGCVADSKSLSQFLGDQAMPRFEPTLENLGQHRSYHGLPTQTMIEWRIRTQTAARHMG